MSGNQLLPGNGPLAGPRNRPGSLKTGLLPDTAEVVQAVQHFSLRYPDTFHHRHSSYEDLVAANMSLIKQVYCYKTDRAESILNMWYDFRHTGQLRSTLQALRNIEMQLQKADDVKDFIGEVETIRMDEVVSGKLDALGFSLHAHDKTADNTKAEMINLCCFMILQTFQPAATNTTFTIKDEVGNTAAAQLRRDPTGVIFQGCGFRHLSDQALGEPLHEEELFFHPEWANHEMCALMTRMFIHGAIQVPGYPVLSKSICSAMAGIISHAMASITDRLANANALETKLVSVISSAFITIVTFLINHMSIA